jgi:hypothetical protein
MPFLTYFLFWESRIPLAFNPDWIRKKLMIATSVIFFILPSLHIFNLWDGYLSFSLYSGKVDGAVYIFGENFLKKLPESARIKTTYNSHEKWFELLPDHWSIEEMNSPVYPAARVYLKIGDELCRKAENSDSLSTVYWWWNGSDPVVQSLPCDK